MLLKNICLLMLRIRFVRKKMFTCLLKGIIICLRYRFAAQSRQSARLFLQSPELGPTPWPWGECVPSLVLGGRDTLACGIGGGGSQFRRGDGALWLGIYALHGLQVWHEHLVGEAAVRVPAPAEVRGGGHVSLLHHARPEPRLPHPGSVDLWCDQNRLTNGGSIVHP